MTQSRQQRKTSFRGAAVRRPHSWLRHNHSETLLTPVRKRHPTYVFVFTACWIGVLAVQAFAQNTARPTLDELPPHHNPPDLSVVSAREWDAIDTAIDRGLRYFAAQQRADGAIPTYPSGTPAVTSLAVMSFLAAGHQPGSGPFGTTIDRAIDYVLNCQREDGLFTSQPTNVPVSDWDEATHVATYNHAIAGLMLGEVYGMTSPKQAARIRPAIEKAIDYTRTLQLQPIPAQYAHDRGGWRYIELGPGHGKYSDLSVTSWFIMFYRSVHNAGFDVPQQWVDDAVDYVERCFEKHSGCFVYTISGDRRRTRGMTGAGIVSLFLTGRYDNEIERIAGQWILQQEFTRFNRSRLRWDRYYYACYYCSQASYQLGGDFWAKTYPPMARTLAANQRSDGSWEQCHFNGVYGPQYATAMSILALTPPYQLLPIYQR